MQTTPHIVFQIQTTPFATAGARETLDTLLMLASFDVKLSLVFRDKGVWQLVATQACSIHALAITPVVQALSHYGIPQLFALDNSLLAYGLLPHDLIENVVLIKQVDLDQLIQSADYVYALSL